MKTEFKYNLQLFAAAEGTITTADLEPAISVDFTSRISENIKTLQTLFGITEMQAMAQGTVIKSYKMESGATAAQVGEGETIGLTKVTRKLVWSKELVLKKYRKVTTAEDIQKVGYNTAVNKTDSKLVSAIQKEVKDDMFTALKTGTGTATGTNLQKTLAALWGALQVRFEDMDVTPVYFINPTDVAEYLGNAQVTMQTTFGLSYIENFLGMGTAIITSGVDAKAPIATTKENINGAYTPASGDLATAFGLTYDDTGIVGMTHAATTNNASIETLLLSGAIFFPEFADGVFKGTIAGA